MKKAVIFVALLLLPFAYAQLDWSITDLRCGNGKLDEFELCEKDVEFSKCDILAEKLGIDMGCYEQHCTCVPRVNPVYCGNNRRDFNEMCDGSGEDVCHVLAEIMGNVTLKCNPKTCGCDIVDVPVDYSPAVIERFQNATQAASKCGDKKVERDEDCDPPNTLCTTSTKEPGICTEKCKCLSPDQLDEEETTPVPAEANLTANATEMPENVTPTLTVEPEAEEKPGFFSRLWAWLVGLFS
ncbi:MAG: hypothetical protein QW165_04275 [Candidatus Woesearchaeota archaeon]